jgi:hypothetical protein
MVTLELPYPPTANTIWRRGQGPACKTAEGLSSRVYIPREDGASKICIHIRDSAW